MKTKNHNGFLKEEINLSSKQKRSLFSLLEEDCNDIKLPFLLIKKVSLNEDFKPDIKFSVNEDEDCFYGPFEKARYLRTKEGAKNYIDFINNSQQVFQILNNYIIEDVPYYHKEYENEVVVKNITMEIKDELLKKEIAKVENKRIVKENFKKLIEKGDYLVVGKIQYNFNFLLNFFKTLKCLKCYKKAKEK